MTGKMKGVLGIEVEISIVGFFWVGNFTGIFWWLDLVGILILGIFDQNKMEARASGRVLLRNTTRNLFTRLLEILKARKFSMEFLGD